MGSMSYGATTSIDPSSSWGLKGFHTVPGPISYGDCGPGEGVLGPIGEPIRNRPDRDLLVTGSLGALSKFSYGNTGFTGFF